MGITPLWRSWRWRLLWFFVALFFLTAFFYSAYQSIHWLSNTGAI